MTSHARTAVKIGFSLFVICAISAAAFYSMNSFERDIFEKYRPLLFCFVALSASMCFACLCPRPVVTLLVCAAAAAGMWFVTPVYVGLFFPVVLQTVLCDVSERQANADVGVFYAALIGDVGTLFLWLYCRSYDAFQLSGYGAPERLTEKIVYLVFFVLLLMYVGFLVFRYKNGQTRIGKGAQLKAKDGKTGAPEKKTAATTAIQLKKNKAAAKRGAAALTVCAVNALSQLIYGLVFFKVEYCKAFFFSQVLFLLFLALRQSPMLWPYDLLNRFLDAATKREDTIDL